MQSAYHKNACKNVFTVNFLHPTCPSTTFYGVARQDKCLVSLTHDLRKVPQLNLAATWNLCS